MALVHLPGWSLPLSHPCAPREAFQCSECGAILYPPDPGKCCPVCANEEAENE